MMREYEKVNGLILTIENEFLNELFSDNDITYSETYTKYLDKYRYLLYWLKRYFKSRYWDINELYFSEIYSNKGL